MIQRERKMMPKRIKKKSGLEILKMHGIMSYAQTMEWKGPLSYRIDDTCVIDTSSRFMEPLLIRRHLSMQVRFRLQDAKEL